jgi:hypothetical protein
MATQAVTPDPNANPFDTPLGSETQESQQRQAASPEGNPFDEPLASEKAEADRAAPNAYQKATAAGPYAPAGGAEKAMGQEMGDNKAQAVQAAKSTAQAALETAGGVAGAGPAAALEEGSAAVLSHLATTYGAPAMKAISDAAKAHPILAELIKDGLKTAGATKIFEYMSKYGKH